MVFRERRPSRHRAQEGELPQVAADRELESFLTSLTPGRSSGEVAGGASSTDATQVTNKPLPADPTSSAAGKLTGDKGGKQPGRRLPHIERDTDNASERTTRFSNAQTFQVRLPELRAEALRTIARERATSPTAMMLQWVLERLEREEAAPVPASVPPAPRRETESVAVRAPLDELPQLDDYVPPPPGELLQPATALLGADEPVASLSPVDQLNPVGELTTVTPVAPPPTAPVTPLFRHQSGAHASPEPEPEAEKTRRGPRHRAPEPVTSLHTRRKF
jgi:hypothetical protein